MKEYGVLTRSGDVLAIGTLENALDRAAIWSKWTKIQYDIVCRTPNGAWELFSVAEAAEEEIAASGA